MYLVINKCVTAVKVSNFSGHYLRNRSTSDIGILGYIGIVQHKEHSPKVLSIPPGTPCMVLKLGRFGQQIRNIWKVLKCGAGEGRKRSVGPIVWEMKKSYIGSRRKGPT